MSKAREVARNIAAAARIHAGLDITAWFNQQHLRDAIRREEGPRTKVEPTSIIAEYERAGVIEQMHGGYYRFKWNYGRLLQKLGEAHGLPLEALYSTGPGDFEPNDVRSINNPPTWRGNPKANDNRRRPFDVGNRDDPDYLEPE
jgi:hypothetical protein